MLTWLSEDPWPIAGVLSVILLIFLVALRFTQNGLYLIRAGITLAAIVLLFGLEYVWVTDNERLEAAVYALAKAVESTDIPAVMSHFTSDVQFKQRDETVDGIIFDEPFVRSQLEHIQFDFVRVRKLTTKVSPQSRRGSAEFEVLLSGTQTKNSNFDRAGAFSSTWSLGFQETSPGVWKINEIRPITLPYGSLIRGMGRGVLPPERGSGRGR